MKNILTFLAFVFILFSIEYKDVKGQGFNSSSLGESIKLLTARNIYISGEQIQFVATLLHHDNSSNISLASVKDASELNELLKNLKSKNTSNVTYVEVITPEGVKISSGKYQSNNSICSGCISIPKDINTGMYYIRAYTKYMRNDGPKAYSYVLLKIVNPFKPDVVPYKYIDSLSIDDTFIEDSLNNNEIIAMSLDKQEYSTREHASIHVKMGSLKDIKIKNLSLSVIPESSVGKNYKAEPVVGNSLNNIYYFPERNGISLTGKLKDLISDKPLQSTIINLSILGDEKDFMTTKTDSTGQFYFKMPDYLGVKDIFLDSETGSDSKSKILIDNDFCQNMVKLPTPVFYLSDNEKRTVYNLALNSQIASHFATNLTVDSTTINDKPFYGKPQVELLIDKFIQLPALEDYFNEFLSSTVTIKKKQGKKYFDIYSPQSGISSWKPLVLLDMVKIDDADKILTLSPLKVSRIEIVNSIYIKGDYTYGGIISIISKKGDFAGIDLPSSGLFLEYNFWSNCTFNQQIIPVSKNQPDFRNTLLWEPQIILDSNSTKEISFNTSDTPGRYTAVLQGVTKDGKVFVFKKSFVVGNNLKSETDK